MHPSSKKKNQIIQYSENNETSRESYDGVCISFSSGGEQTMYGPAHKRQRSQREHPTAEQEMKCKWHGSHTNAQAYEKHIGKHAHTLTAHAHAKIGFAHTQSSHREPTLRQISAHQSAATATAQHDLPVSTRYPSDRFTHPCSPVPHAERTASPRTQEPAARLPVPAVCLAVRPIGPPRSRERTSRTGGDKRPQTSRPAS